MSITVLYFKCRPKSLFSNIRLKLKPRDLCCNHESIPLLSLTNGIQTKNIWIIYFRSNRKWLKHIWKFHYVQCFVLLQIFRIERFMECATAFAMHSNSLKRKCTMNFSIPTGAQDEKNHHAKVVVAKIPNFSEVFFCSQISFHSFVRVRSFHSLQYDISNIY